MVVSRPTPQHTRSSMFAHLFDSNSLSDVRLQLVIPRDLPSSSKRPREEGNEEGNDEGNEEGNEEGNDEVLLRSYRTHAVLLATASPVLSAHIQRWSVSNSTCIDGLKTIRVVVHADEAQAAEDVLRSIYHNGVPQPASGADVPHMFRMFVIADRLEVVSVRNAVLALAKPTSVEDVNFVFAKARQVAPSLWHHPQMLKLRTMCTQHTVSLFGDVTAVLHENGVLLSLFRGLCFEAVSEFAKSDHLRVHSETDILVLLSAWIRTNEGCSESQLKMLMWWALRPLHLSASYFANLATVAPWAFHAPTMARLTYCRIQPNAISTELKRWVPHAKPRVVVSGGIIMTLAICRVDLDELFQCASESPTKWSPASYHHGYMWQVGLSRERIDMNAPPSNQCQFICRVQLRADLPCNMLVPGAKADVPYLPCLLGCKVGDNDRTERCVSTTPDTVSIIDIGSHFNTAAGVPVADIDGMAPFTDADGDVTISAEVWLRD